MSIYKSFLSINSSNIFLFSILPPFLLELPLGKRAFGLASLKGVFGCSLVFDISLECFRHIGIGIFDRMLFCWYLSFTVVLLKVLEAFVTRFTVFDSVFLLLSGQLFLRASSLLLSEFMIFFLPWILF